MGLCTKFKHKDYNGAIKHINALKRKANIPMGAYYCPSCNAYHVTRNIKGKGKFVKFKG